MEFQRQNSTIRLDTNHKPIMKAAYTLLNADIEIGGGAGMPYRNVSTIFQPTSIEGAFLFMVALAGGLGNVSVMVITLICPTFRQMSTAFLFHHCLLDAIKSGFCIPFGYSLVYSSDIPHCDIIGATYIFLMTVSAYNLLALLVNEEYHCSFSSKRTHHKQKDSCCIAFGVVIIWFTTVLLHLGVIFLPGSSEFSKDVGNCVYRHGVTKNYVIHALWVILVTGAIVVASISFVNFFRKLQSSVQSRKWEFLHKSLSSLSPHNNDNSEEVHYEFDDLSSQKAIQLSRHYLRRIIIMMSMVTSFVVCWYPLFVLTLVDVNFKQPGHIYRRLMILAWTHPITTPIFCSVIYYHTAKGEKVTKDVYTNAIPMTASRSGEAIRQEINHMDLSSGETGFHNENFQFTLNHTGVSTSQQDSECDSSQYNNITTTTTTPTASTATQFDTVVNYNTDDCRYQTLIM